jgi:hypothetical protein
MGTDISPTFSHLSTFANKVIFTSTPTAPLLANYVLSGLLYRSTSESTFLRFTHSIGLSVGLLFDPGDGASTFFRNASEPSTKLYGVTSQKLLLGNSECGFAVNVQSKIS